MTQDQVLEKLDAQTGVIQAADRAQLSRLVFITTTNGLYLVDLDLLEAATADAEATVEAHQDVVEKIGSQIHNATTLGRVATDIDPYTVYELLPA